jgi:uncharacterized membrane protein
VIHAGLVHFPIVLALLWPVMDAAGLVFRKPDLEGVALGLLGLGGLMSVAAALTGQLAYDDAIRAGIARGLLETHSALAEAMPWVFLVLLGFRMYAAKVGRKVARWAAIGLGLGFAVTLLWVGHTGGRLVYHHSVGLSRDGSGVAPFVESKRPSR